MGGCIVSEIEKSAFNLLNAVDCSKYIEKKNGLSYLPWAWAWCELKKRYPLSYYTIYESSSGCAYHTDGRTCWVKTGVTLVDGDNKLEYIEYLPIMDFKNKSIPLNAVTSMDMNKAIQRSLTKACARHGLGLYVYAGEDLPEEAPPQDELKPGDGKKLAVEQSAPAQVKTSATVPASAPTTTAWNPNAAIQRWCEGKGITNTMFNARHNQLISAGIVENIAYSQLDPDHFDKLIKAMEANFKAEAAS